MYIHLKQPHVDWEHCETPARAAVTETRFLQKCLAYKLISSLTLCLKHDEARALCALRRGDICGFGAAFSCHEGCCSTF